MQYLQIGHPKTVKWFITVQLPFKRARLLGVNGSNFLGLIINKLEKQFLECVEKARQLDVSVMDNVFTFSPSGE